MYYFVANFDQDFEHSMCSDRSDDNMLEGGFSLTSCLLLVLALVPMPATHIDVKFH